MESFILAGTALILEKDIKKDQENSAHNYTDSPNSHDSYHRLAVKRKNLFLKERLPLFANMSSK